MATTFLRTPSLQAPTSRLRPSSSKPTKQLTRVFLKQRQKLPNRSRIHTSYSPTTHLSHRLLKLVPFAAHGETTATDDKELKDVIEESETLQDIVDEAVGEEDSETDATNVEVEEPASAILSTLKLYKEALVSDDESKVAEIEAFLKSLEDEKIDLESKVTALSAEVSNEKTRVLRISADFDNFRKRTERDRLSLVTNAQGELVESLLPVLDNFERAKAQIKVETEGEQKIVNSYQSIYKQFVEILGSLGVVPVEPVGNPFDPLLHEAIMREESTEFEEGVVIEEYRKGFQLGDRLLRPSMVKVSAGPGPAKAVESAEPPEVAEDATEAAVEADTEEKSPEN